MNRESHNRPKIIGSPLHAATRSGHTDVVMHLIKEHGESVNQDEHGYRPLHLAVWQKRKELALSLVEHGASLNQKDTRGRLPLHIAAKHGHTELAISLVELGASVKQNDGRGCLPLHLALTQHHDELALSLIKLGASVDQEDFLRHLHINCYMNVIDINDAYFNNELFTQLIPGKARYMDIIKISCKLLRVKTAFNHMEVLSKMLHKLIQGLIVTGHVSITTTNQHTYFDVLLNSSFFFRGSFKEVYMCSVLFIILRSDVVFENGVVPLLEASATSEEFHHAHAIDDLWNAYKQKTGVKTLQTLCIQTTRKSMHSLTDESFQSLPVPSRIRKFLMLHDEADVLFEAYQMWPKCMPIEALM